MRDDYTFNVQFVQLVEKYRVLYDYNEEGYCNRQVQDKVWNDIGKEVNETGAACKEKWKNIRSAFTRYLRQKSPSGSTAPCKKKYYLADYLQFVIPFTKPRNPQSKRSPCETIEYETIEEVSSGNDQDSEDYTHSNLQDAEIESNVTYALDTTMRQKMCEKSDIRGEACKDTKRKGDEMDPIEKCALEYFPYKKAKPTEEDSDLMFLKSLLPDIRRMNDLQKYRFKVKILQAIGDTLYESVACHRNAAS